MSTDPKDLVRLDVAAQALGVARKTVRKYCECGKLDCRRLPFGHWRVVRRSLDTLLSEMGLPHIAPK